MSEIGLELGKLKTSISPLGYRRSKDFFMVIINCNKSTL